MRNVIIATIGCCACLAATALHAKDGRDPAPAIAKPPCEFARVLKIRTVERAEGPVGGPAPPTKEHAAAPSRSISSSLYYISLECDGKAYVARVSGGAAGFNPDELDAASILRVRVAGKKVFLKSEPGTEFEAILAAVPSAGPSPPK